MRTLKSIYTITLLSIVTFLNAQISTNELPYSFLEENQYQIPQKKKINESLMAILPISLQALEEEDLIADASGKPLRFGYPIEINKDLFNSGEWITLANGDRLWQLEINSPGALSINLLYDKFWLPDGGKLFIYSKDKTKYMGAFTSYNNKGDKNEIQGFATGLINSDQIVLEYYEPRDVESSGIISIAYVVHAYRSFDFTESDRALAAAGSCINNVNCAVGSDWQSEKKAVARIVIDGAHFCTGALIRTTSNTPLEPIPYFLTADHCLYGYDAISNPNLNYWTFYWDYECPTCTCTGQPSGLSTSGAKLLANDSYSDFALMELTEDPKLLSGYNAYFLGWDRTTNPGAGGVTIHHPAGDVKKISVYTDTPDRGLSDWTINSSSTKPFIAEGGSSGAPLLNAQHRLIGQLWSISGTLSCNNPNGYVNAGRFSDSWDNRYSTSATRRLKDWLDPENKNSQYVTGYSTVSNHILVNGEIYGLTSGTTRFYTWGRRYNAYSNREIRVYFKTNKNNLTCTPIEGDVNYYFTNRGNGEYSLTFTFYDGRCEFRFSDGSRYEYLAFSQESDSEELSITKEYSFYPNPVSNVINIEFKPTLKANEVHTVSLYSQTGKLEKRETSNNKRVNIHVSNLPNGIYFLHIYNNSGEKIGEEKIIVQH